VPNTDEGRDHAKSLITAFREAGFKTYWISNQEPIGIHESEITHFSREADESVFMNLSIRTMHKDGFFDEHIISPLAQFLARREPKQFFVLHMLGAHDSYQRRYPPEFDVLQPSLRSLDNPDHHDRRNKLAVENSYDNAMRYTDYVLARMIDTLRAQNAISALVYSADHGETLFDGNCERSGHGSSSRQEFPIAAMVWVSKEYKTQWPKRFARLSENASAPITTEAILPTMLNLASIDARGIDWSRSLVSDAFRRQTRWVNAPDPIDWDTATTRGACNLLVGTKSKEHPVIAVSGHLTASRTEH
jgi:glucan phosphoethanolaminetransferase (alkaline phosphatase superfamily)